MPRTLQELESEALELPIEARDRLAARLLKSLEPVEREAPSQEATQKQSKWANLAKRYRENPNLRGSSEKVNALVQEFREDFVL
ncbi:MAG: hypothetical protein GY719_10595 [bacterium]|nr:hypothetical protein [bacterium]